MIFPKYRYAPISDPDRKRCPVCQQSVYSLAGIHPQCAVKQANALEWLRRKAASKQDSIDPIEPALQPVIPADDEWQSQAEMKLCN
jgi:Tat protein secretion system quality control protein TatD with DNase activity